MRSSGVAAFVVIALAVPFASCSCSGSNSGLRQLDAGAPALGQPNPRPSSASSSAPFSATCPSSAPVSCSDGCCPPGATCGADGGCELPPGTASCSGMTCAASTTCSLGDCFVPDLSGHGNDLQVTNGGVLVQGKEAEALRLIPSGRSELIAPEATAPLHGFPPIGAPITVEAWVRTSFAGSQWQGLFGFPNGTLTLQTSGNWDWPWVSCGQGSGPSSGLFIQDGGWHFLVATSDGDAGVLYLDGAPLPACAQSSAGAYTADRFWLGDLPESSGSIFDGDFDDVRVLDYAATPQQVQQDFLTLPLADSPGTIALWTFDTAATTCCPSGDTCSPSGACIPASSGATTPVCPSSAPVDCGDGGCCPPGLVCNPSGCGPPPVVGCPSNYPVPCDGNCCAPGDTCSNGYCVPPDAGMVQLPWPDAGGVACDGAQCAAGEDCVDGLHCCPTGIPYGCGNFCCPTSTAACDTTRGCEVLGASPSCDGGLTLCGSECCGSGATCQGNHCVTAQAQPAQCGVGTLACGDTCCGAAPGCTGIGDSCYCAAGGCKPQVPSCPCPPGAYCGTSSHGDWITCHLQPTPPVPPAGVDAGSGLGPSCGGNSWCAVGTVCSGPDCCPQDHPVACGASCCLSGAACTNGSCGCPGGDPPCGSQCCGAGAACQGGQCVSACPAGFPTPCGAVCCASGIQCGASGCECPSDHPVSCGESCCLPNAPCTNGSCGCPTDRPSCGDLCCPSGQSCVNGSCAAQPSGGPSNLTVTITSATCVNDQLVVQGTATGPDTSFFFVSDGITDLATSSCSPWFSNEGGGCNRGQSTSDTISWTSSQDETSIAPQNLTISVKGGINNVAAILTTTTVNCP